MDVTPGPRLSVNREGTPVLGWLLNLCYVGILTLASPVLVYRSWKHGKYRAGWSEKFRGDLRRQHSGRPCLWFHAVSVGEVLLLKHLLADVAREYPHHEIVITTTTHTGHAVAVKQFPHATVRYYPLDFTWAVRRALRQIRPDAVFLAELELWPNFVAAAHARHIPVLVINGRLSERSYRGYRKLRWLMGWMLRKVQCVAAQSEEYGERFVALGLPPDRLVVTGNLKYDRLETSRDNRRTRELRDFFQLKGGAPVFMAGSTQAPEEAYALDTWQSLRQQWPDLQLILVPRHQERFEEVAALVAERGYALLRRSGKGGPPGDAPCVRLLDTLGELSAAWGLADIAFVGGSLTNRGGQNMIEPAGYGAAVLFGPNTQNFRQTTQALLAQEAARAITGPEALTAAVGELLGDPSVGRAMGERARTFVLSQQGATERTLAEIKRGVIATVEHGRSAA